MNAEEQRAELERLKAAPLKQETETALFEPPLRLMDGPSFAPQYEEIFLSEVYAFPFDGDHPVIIDGGANVGAGVIWWRSRWPEAIIVAFEPDPRIFEILEWNTRYQAGLDLRCAAVGALGSEGLFSAEGTDAGRLIRPSEVVEDRIEVTVERLRDILEEHVAVDFLKLDIEGAETTALLDAEDDLDRVARIFVEYHSFVGEEQRLDELLGLLRRSGFRYYIETPIRSIRPFFGTAVNRMIDLQCNIFASRPATYIDASSGAGS